MVFSKNTKCYKKWLALSSLRIFQVNLMLYAVFLFISLGCVMQDVLLICVSEGKKYWDIRATG